MAEVYWIHLPEHTDMFSEGYIGFTSKTAKERFKSHIGTQRYGGNGCAVLKNAIAKYGDSLVVDTLCICSNAYGLDLERKLRPEPHIGWNISVGGGAPMLGRKQPKETIEKQKQSWRESCTPERIAFHTFHLHKKRATKEVLSKAQQKIAKERSIYKGQRVDPYVWVNAEVFLTAYLRGVKKKTVEKALHAPSKKYNTLWKNFENGWRPTEDAGWFVYKENHIEYFDNGLFEVLSELGTPEEQSKKSIEKRKRVNGT